jgi:hypothetical protein
MSLNFQTVSPDMKVSKSVTNHKNLMSVKKNPDNLQMGEIFNRKTILAPKIAGKAEINKSFDISS